MNVRPSLSQAPSAISWLRQFSTKDQKSAAILIDSLVLLNDDDVATALRSQLAALAKSRKGPRSKIALFVEREYPQTEFFPSQRLAGRDGIQRRRATGDKGPLAVQPNRGGVRVGSEGSIASIVSQSVEANRTIFLNHPGPDRIRRNKVGLIVIVTDFIGSGGRVRAILDKMMATPSVRSWRANRWIDFAVVAAAGTNVGIAHALRHRVAPMLHVTHVVPTLDTFHDQGLVAEWMELFSTYGPRNARGAGPTGYNENGALVALSYRTPNNVPLILNADDRNWRALFRGPAADDMRPAFGLQPLKQRVTSAARILDESLADDLTETEGRMVLVLRALRGKWRADEELALAERAGLTVSEINLVKRRAIDLGLINSDGRLTDAGQRFTRSGARGERHKPTVPTRPELYYPQSLRVPR